MTKQSRSHRFKILTAATVVKAIRDGRATSVETLNIALDGHRAPPDYGDSPVFSRLLTRSRGVIRGAIAEFVAQLLRAGVLTGNDDDLRVSERWTEMARAVGVSLTAAEETRYRDALVVQPAFGVPPNPPQTSVFVAMPFAPAPGWVR